MGFLLLLLPMLFGIISKKPSAQTKTSRSTPAFALTFRYLFHFVLIHMYKMCVGQPHAAWILNCYTSHF